MCQGILSFHGAEWSSFTATNTISEQVVRSVAVRVQDDVLSDVGLAGAVERFAFHQESFFF